MLAAGWRGISKDVVARIWWRSNHLPSRKGGGQMPTSEDYKRLANRSAQLAIECPTPSVAEALMALALDHLRRAASLSGAAVSEQQQLAQEPSDGFGD
jgi:hypothetical protein